MKLKFFASLTALALTAASAVGDPADVYENTGIGLSTGPRSMPLALSTTWEPFSSSVGMAFHTPLLIR